MRLQYKIKFALNQLETTLQILTSLYSFDKHGISSNCTLGFFSYNENNKSPHAAFVNTSGSFFIPYRLDLTWNNVGHLSPQELVISMQREILIWFSAPVDMLSSEEQVMHRCLNAPGSPPTCNALAVPSWPATNMHSFLKVTPYDLQWLGRV